MPFLTCISVMKALWYFLKVTILFCEKIKRNMKKYFPIFYKYIHQFYFRFLEISKTSKWNLMYIINTRYLFHISYGFISQNLKYSFFGHSVVYKKYKIVRIHINLIWPYINNTRFKILTIFRQVYLEGLKRRSETLKPHIGKSVNVNNMCVIS